MQVPEAGPIKDPKELVGKTVATSFVSLTSKYFAELEGLDPTDPSAKLKTTIKFLGGSVETACALGVADGIVDLVGTVSPSTHPFVPSTPIGSELIEPAIHTESGETMVAAGLHALSTVVSSTAVLIRSKHSTSPHLASLITSRIHGFVTAQRYVLCQYNIPRSGLEAATKITPGKRAPTINALDREGWVAVSSMVEKAGVARVMDELVEVGAEDILELSISNTRMGDLGPK